MNGHAVPYASDVAEPDVFRERLHSMIHTAMRPLLLLLVLAPLSTAAQPFGDATDEVFADDVLATVRVTLDPVDLAAILDPANAQSDVEYMATFEFDSPYVTATFDSVGFRLRGNTSRNSQKKSFRVSFNTFIPGGDFRGLEKLNLNGEHNDPSIMRSKLSWDLFGTVDVPSSRASHARLYVNGEYFGLYMNVEQIDERFLKRRFGNDDGFLIKCVYGADLTVLDTGACAVQLGADEAAAYADLEKFIATINGGSKVALERDLDVNGFLRYLAVTVATGSWDSYWFLKNNFYLYHDPSDDRYHVIPFDYDNTFGIWWDGICCGSGNPALDWSSRNVYVWGYPNELRPLAKNVLDVPEFRERYTLYLKRLLADGFDPEPLKSRALVLRDLTAVAAEEDMFRTLDWDYSIDDYYDSYTIALADRNLDRQGHVKSGLLPYIDARHLHALAQLDPGNIAPVISDVVVSPSPARPVDPIEVTVRVEDEGLPTVEVEYWPSGPDGLLVSANPAPDLGPDFWRAVVPPTGTTGYLDVRVRAQDDEGAIRTGPLITLAVNDERPLLFLNELMALNATTIVDESGEADDWAEIVNAGDTDVSLGGLFLSDDAANPDRWALPDVTVPAGGFRVLWLDGTPGQGLLHGPFRLSGGGEYLALFDSDLTALDQVSFGAQTTDVPLGRAQDAFGPWVALAYATPGASNNAATDRERTEPMEWRVDVWPNPFHDRLKIQLGSPSTVVVLDLLGREIMRLAMPGAGSREWNGRDRSGNPVPSGLYLVRIEDARGSRLGVTTIPVIRIR